MRKPVVLITGANGEMGHALVANLAQQRNLAVVALDLNALDPQLARLVQREVAGSVLDNNLLERLLAEFEIDLIFHLAALLSSRAEFTPMAAHQVNVEGTLNLLEFSARQAESHGRQVVFVYPSSIAAYGLPDLTGIRRYIQGPHRRRANRSEQSQDVCRHGGMHRFESAGHEQRWRVHHHRRVSLDQSERDHQRIERGTEPERHRNGRRPDGCAGDVCRHDQFFRPDERHPVGWQQQHAARRTDYLYGHASKAVAVSKAFRCGRI
ncbi:MAG: NAD-dependent epimerase/dehydratase family protein [Acidobacteria bacterium]|nr:NAD-dependent epimerase/dehydratase family protein [Acidobacteriota bacterium]